MSEAYKRQAAEAALVEVKTGMKIGLGTGSTAAWFVKGLAQKVRDQALLVVCVPTSEATAALAQAEGLEVVTLDEVGALDLAVDGADEIGPGLSLIKGGGAALLREKIIAFAASRFVVIADDSKCVATLGAFALPVEVIPFAAEVTLGHIRAALKGCGIVCEPVIRQRNSATVVTDNGNWIVDCPCGVIADPAAVAVALRAIPGVVDHGLFLSMAHVAYVAGADGVRVLTPSAEERIGSL